MLLRFWIRNEEITLYTETFLWGWKEKKSEESREREKVNLRQNINKNSPNTQNSMYIMNDITFIIKEHTF